MEMRIQELERLVEQQAKKIEEQDKKLEDLEAFKQRIETGSYWLRCAFYAVGSIAVFIMAVYEFILKHIKFN